MLPQQKSKQEPRPDTATGGTTSKVLPDPAVVQEWDYKEMLEYLKPLLSKFSDTARKEFEDAQIDGEVFLELGSGRFPPGQGYDEFISAWGLRQKLKDCAMEILAPATGSKKSMFPVPSQQRILKTTCHGGPWASNGDAAPWLVAGSASVPGLWGPLARPAQEHKGPASAAPSVPHHTRFSFAPTHPLHFSVAPRRLGGAVGSFAAAPGQTQEEDEDRVEERGWRRRMEMEDGVELCLSCPRLFV
jgi:hypothetical protein